jgi:hypothetical protein
MTLPIANGLAGSAGHALPEDAVCDWKVATKATFAIGRVATKATVCDWEGILDLRANARTVGMKML